MVASPMVAVFLIVPSALPTIPILVIYPPTLGATVVVVISVVTMMVSVFVSSFLIFGLGITPGLFEQTSSAHKIVHQGLIRSLFPLLDR